MGKSGEVQTETVEGRDGTDAKLSDECPPELMHGLSNPNNCVPSHHAVGSVERAVARAI